MTSVDALSTRKRFCPIAEEQRIEDLGILTEERVVCKRNRSA
jgi:hypothetical protein